ELVFVQAAQAVDVTTDGAQVTHSFGDIAGAGLTLGANHCGTFGDTTKRLTQVGSTTDERYVELPFVDVVGVVRWAEHLRFIDEIHAESFQYLRFNEVADARFCHHWNGNRVDDTFDQVGVAHARHATLCTNISWHALQGHDSSCAGCFSNAGLFRGHHIHNHPALEGICNTALDGRYRGIWGGILFFFDKCLSHKNHLTLKSGL